MGSCRPNQITEAPVAVASCSARGTRIVSRANTKKIASTKMNHPPTGQSKWSGSCQMPVSLSTPGTRFSTTHRIRTHTTKTQANSRTLFLKRARHSGDPLPCEQAGGEEEQRHTHGSQHLGRCDPPRRGKTLCVRVDDCVVQDHENYSHPARSVRPRDADFLCRWWQRFPSVIHQRTPKAMTAISLGARPR
jgi:hypothetical protein